ncbi:hypothetical protein E4U11_007727 [Claviceps purpurea]|nr:hypothetical protein E4U11_007727 [Claviceps purpurea]
MVTTVTFREHPFLSRALLSPASQMDPALVVPSRFGRKPDQIPSKAQISLEARKLRFRPQRPSHTVATVTSQDHPFLSRALPSSASQMDPVLVVPSRFGRKPNLISSKAQISLEARKLRFRPQQASHTVATVTSQDHPNPRRALLSPASQMHPALVVPSRFGRKPDLNPSEAQIVLEARKPARPSQAAAAPDRVPAA